MKRLLVIGMVMMIGVCFCSVNGFSATYDATGTWDYSTTGNWVNPGNADCAAESDETGVAYVTQNGNNITIVADGITYSGTVSGANYSLSASSSYPEDGGTNTTSLNFSLSSSTSGSGTIAWSWTDGYYYCNGGGNISMTKRLTVDWVSINGDITTQDGTPVCAMALANGQYMFSGDPRGKYNLSVPLDENGQITLFVFADGFAPLKYIFTPEGTSENIDITMLPAPPDSPQMTLKCQFDTAENPGWVRISGQARAEDGSAPLCAMVLGNGQYMFSNAGNGEYELEVPLDENGQITLFGFADGFQPFKEVLDR